MKLLIKAFIEKQQKGEGTDCSFVFDVPSADGKTSTKKVVHAHKFVLTNVSSYFETNFKSEWNGNQPIRVTTIQHKVFEKLIKAIYLSSIWFETLDEALDLYEAAHFYQIELVLDLLREEIQKFWFTFKTIEIGRLLNTTWKYQDWQILHFAMKCFTVNASQILEDADWLSYSPEIINFLYSSHDISATEQDLFKALEKFCHHHESITIETLKPAIKSIRFDAISKDNIKKTPLLTEAEKESLLEMKKIDSVHESISRKPRTVKPFFYELSYETQIQLAEVYSKEICWYCNKQDHGVLTCESAYSKSFLFYHYDRHKRLIDIK